MLKFRKNIKQILVVFTACILLISCGYKEVELKEIQSVKLEEFSSDGLIVKSKVVIYNPNSFKIKVSNSNIDIFLKNQAIGSAKIDNAVTLAANSTEEHTIIFKSEYKDLNTTALPMLIGLTAFGNKELDFKFKGTVTGKVFLFTKKVEIEHQEKIRLDY